MLTKPYLTLADALLMTFDNGKLIDNITHLVPTRDDLLGSIERGDLDASLLDSRRLDAYRAIHPDTKLIATGYFYPIGVNRAYVGLAGDTALLAEVNKALSALQADGTVAKLAQAVGVSYLPPREPIILGDAMMKALHQK